MKPSVILRGSLLAITVLLLTLSARTAPPASTPVAGAAEDSATVSMGCTVRSVDIKSRTVEVITGVGYALRLYRMKVAPSCEIHIEGAPAGLIGLKPGTIVRVRFTKAPAGPKSPAPWVATAIESAPKLDGGGAR